MPTRVPPDNGKNRPINVKSVEVTRMSVDKSEVKDMHVDLLEAVHAAIGEAADQSVKNAKDITGRSSLESLEKTFRDQIENLVAVVRESSVSGGGESSENLENLGKNAKLSAAEFGVWRKILESANKTTKEYKENTSEMSKTIDGLRELFREQAEVPLKTLRLRILETANEFTSFSTVTKEITQKFRDDMELYGAGITDFSDIWTSNLVKIFKFGLGEPIDDLTNTARFVKEQVENGLTSPMRLFGGDIEKTAKGLAQFRKDMEDAGAGLYTRLGYGEQNEFAAQMLELEQRSSVQQVIRDARMDKQYIDQFNILKIVASNTGESVKELNKKTLKDAKSIKELQNIGRLTADEAAHATEISKGLRGETLDFYLKFLEAGKNWGDFAIRFPAEFKEAQVSGLKDTWDVMQRVSDDNVNAIDAANTINQSIRDVTHRFWKDTSGSSTVQLKLLEGQEKHLRDLSTSANLQMDLQKDISKDSPVATAWNKFEDWAVNKWPIASLKSISAVAYNTVAILGNTAALAWVGARLRGGLGGGVAGAAAESLGGAGAAAAGAGGALSKILGVGKLALKGAGAAGGILATGKDVYDLAQGDTSASNTAGLIGSVLGGIAGFAIGGPVGAAIGAGIGNAGGDFLGGLFDTTPSTPATPAPSTITSAGAAPATTGGVSQLMQDVAASSRKQVQILAELAAQSMQSNSIQRDIRDRIGIGGNDGIAPKGRDVVSATSNAAITTSTLGG